MRRGRHGRKWEGSRCEGKVGEGGGGRAGSVLLVCCLACFACLLERSQV